MFTSELECETGHIHDTNKRRRKKKRENIPNINLTTRTVRSKSDRHLLTKRKLTHLRTIFQHSIKLILRD